MKSNIDEFFIKNDGEKICQGDIFRDFKVQLVFKKKGDSPKSKDFTIPYVVILTQDCDLDEDFINRTSDEEKYRIKQDKYLQSILVCPMYLAEKLRRGTHLEDLELSMEKFDHGRWDIIIKNQNARYHYLKGEQDLQIPNCVIDFKHYYTILRDILYYDVKSHYIATVNELFRESLSQRFGYYLSRIGLPILEKPPRPCDE
jgi:hypothetical protein